MVVSKEGILYNSQEDAVLVSTQIT